MHRGNVEEDSPALYSSAVDVGSKGKLGVSWVTDAKTVGVRDDVGEGDGALGRGGVDGLEMRSAEETV